MSGESMNVIDKLNSDLILSIVSGEPFKEGQFWNVEILENYIRVENIPCCIFYYREIPSQQKFVLVRTRSIMECPSKDLKCLCFVELANKHKMLVEQLPGEKDCQIRFRDTDFSLPILYDFPSTNYLASFSDDNLFLAVHLARLYVVTRFAACGYKYFSDIFGMCLPFTNNLC